MQRFEVPELGLLRLCHRVLHRAFWIHVVEYRGCIVDEAISRCLSARRPTFGRRLLAFTLSGDARIRAADSIDCWVDAGVAHLCDGRATFAARVDASQRRSLSFNIEWDTESYCSPPVGRHIFGRCSSAARLSVLVDALRAAIENAWKNSQRLGEVVTETAELLAVLRADGFYVPPLAGPGLVGYEDARLQRLSGALDRALSLSGSRPMMVDLEELVGQSSRSVQRHLPDVLRLWGQQPETFRSLRGRIRAFQASMLMSHRGATTEAAARIFGFASPNVFCRTLSDAGLPSPGRIRHALSALA